MRRAAAIVGVRRGRKRRRRTRNDARFWHTRYSITRSRWVLLLRLFKQALRRLTKCSHAVSAALPSASLTSRVPSSAPPPPLVECPILRSINRCRCEDRAPTWLRAISPELVFVPLLEVSARVKLLVLATPTDTPPTPPAGGCESPSGLSPCRGGSVACSRLVDDLVARGRGGSPGWAALASPRVLLFLRRSTVGGCGGRLLLRAGAVAAEADGRRLNSNSSS
mmetsp:Transcript_1921/g.4198  ORF Transcript_1921/g.4198 Transcript_1921/m.4198 type:complete len:223 (-) Transcript_1921:30-698(-)